MILFSLRQGALGLVGWVLPIALIIFFMRRAGGLGRAGGIGGAGGGGRGGIMGFGQSTARIVKENTGVTFKYLNKNSFFSKGIIIIRMDFYLKGCCRL
jgi:ATP-dependent Zn protease